MSHEVTRRTYLQTLLATGVVTSIAGCNSSQNTPNTETTNTPTETPNQAPRILASDATPEDNGTTLAVSLEGEDDHELDLARIEYGERTIEENPEGASVELNEELTDLATTDLDTTPGQVTFLLRDTAGKETRASVYPDETAPELQTFAVEPTENAGEVAVRLEGRDETALRHAAMLIGEQAPLRKTVSGQAEYSTDQRVSAPEDAQFHQNTVTASLTDWNGNSTESEEETYIRKYDVMDDPRLNIGVNYLLWAGDKFGKCMPLAKAEPSIGHYDDPISPETTSKHIDQMQGHGITNVLINFNGTQGDRRSLKQFTDSQLATDIELRPIYAIKDYRWNPDRTDRNWKDNVVPSDMKFLRDHILSRDNVVTHDGRPVVNIWNAAMIPWDEDYHSGVMEEWGDYESFTEDIRSNLRVEGGEEPFLIGGITGGTAYSGVENSKPQIPAFLRTLDATTSWTAWGPRQDSPAYWEDVLPWVKQNYEGHRTFTDKHDMEFVPMVFPGFNHEMNTCWGSGGVIPRGLNGFEKLLELADEYRTTEMVDVATWNDWTEGSQIEPGKYKGNEYGPEYLQSIKEYQRK